MKKTQLTVILGLIFLLCFNLRSFAQVENTIQNRLNASLRYKVSDQIQIRLNPEIRFTEFSLDKCFLEGEAIYKPFSMLSFSTKYRFISNFRETKDTEYLHKFSIKAKFSYEIGQFEPKLSVAYTNNSDDELNAKLFRYKAALAYNIKKCKISPFIGVEAFHQFKEGEMYKMRYLGGLEYKLNKKNALELSYKLDFYIHKYENRHIIDLGYTYKF